MTVVGGGGLAWVFKFQREDAGKAVEQVDNAMGIMRQLNEDLSAQFTRVTNERDDALHRLAECTHDRLELLRKLHRAEQHGR
jgi:hypothetical protein